MEPRSILVPHRGPRFHRPEPPDDRAEVPDALEESQARGDEVLWV